MDINDYVFGNGVVTPEQQRAIAGSLRNRDNMGAIMALSGDRAVAPVGQEYMKTANKGIQQGLTHNYYQGMLRSSEADRQLRKTLADQATKLGYARLGTMRDIADKKTNLKPVPRGIADQIIGGASSLKTLQELSAEWKDDWHSGIPGMNTFMNFAAREAPGLASKNALEFQDWRRKFVGQLEAIERNKLYGAALTLHEIKYWKDQALRPGANPKQVQGYFQDAQEKIGRELEARANGAAVSYNPYEVQQYLQILQGPAGPAGAAPSAQQEEPLYEILSDE